VGRWWLEVPRLASTCALKALVGLLFFPLIRSEVDSINSSDRGSAESPFTCLSIVSNAVYIMCVCTCVCLCGRIRSSISAEPSAAHMMCHRLSCSPIYVDGVVEQRRLQGSELRNLCRRLPPSIAPTPSPPLFYLSFPFLSRFGCASRRRGLQYFCCCTSVSFVAVCVCVCAALASVASFAVHVHTQLHCFLISFSTAGVVTASVVFFVGQQDSPFHPHVFCFALLFRTHPHAHQHVYIYRHDGR
jgi:hypothetical protein